MVVGGIYSKLYEGPPKVPVRRLLESKDVPEKFISWLDKHNIKTPQDFSNMCEKERNVNEKIIDESGLHLLVREKIAIKNVWLVCRGEPELPPAHVHSIEKFLDNRHASDVRLEARYALETMETEMLVEHMDVILKCFDRWCFTDDVQLDALKALGRLAPKHLAPHVGAILQCPQRWCFNDDVKLETLKVVGTVDPRVLAPHAGVILMCMDRICSSDDVKLETHTGSVGTSCLWYLVELRQGGRK